MSTKVKEKPKEPMFCFKTSKGQKVYYRQDGKFWAKASTYGATVFAPLRESEVVTLLNGTANIKQIDAKMNNVPAGEFRLPNTYITAWARQFLQFNTEVLAIYGRHRKDPSKWFAVVPEQTVTSGSVDIDDFSLAASVLSQKGYQRVGTIHTHPGGMTSCSNTDMTELWDEFGGIHLIITQTGKTAFYYSVKGVTWNLDKSKRFAHFDAWKGKSLEHLPNIPTLCTDLEDSDITMAVNTRTFLQPTNMYDSTNLYPDNFDNGFVNKQTVTPKSHRDPDTYYGEWINNQYVQLIQKEGTKVTYTYFQLSTFSCHFDSKVSSWIAGRPSIKPVKSVISSELVTIPSLADQKFLFDEDDYIRQDTKDHFERHLNSLTKTTEEFIRFLCEIASPQTSKVRRSIIMKSLNYLAQIEALTWGLPLNKTLNNIVSRLPSTWQKG